MDLDGTIRRTKSGAKFISDPLDQELIPEAISAALKFAEDGWIMVGVSNRGGIEEMRYTLQLAHFLDCVYFCPSLKSPEDSCYLVERAEF